MKPVISITWDDGIRSIHDVVFPICKQFDVKCTMYVSTGIVDGPWEIVGTPTLKMDYPITWPKLHEMADAGWEIASHTVTHPNFSKITGDEMHKELKDSKDILTDKGFKVSNFAYPYGAHTCTIDQHLNDQKIPEIVSHHYKSARTTCEGMIDLNNIINRWRLPAISLSVGLNNIKEWIKRGGSQNWIILYGHTVRVPGISNVGEIRDAEHMKQILSYIRDEAGVQIKTVDEVIGHGDIY